MDRISFARDQRQQAGPAEQKVWSLLRASKVDGYKFRRQHPIGPYFCDFACEQLRLIIEIDGKVHERDDVVLSDHERQTWLEQTGWSVLRFSNTQALTDPDSLIRAIREHARQILT